MCLNLLRRFIKDEDGVATVESLLWMPVFFFLFILITDASFIFFGKAQTLRIIQDGNRAYSVSRFETDAEASAYIQGRIREFSPQATVQTTVTNGIIQTRATLPASDLMAVGSIPAFVSSELSVTSQQFMEY
jgi:Flp pilus assembly protein TadG